MVRNLSVRRAAGAGGYHRGMKRLALLWLLLLAACAPASGETSPPATVAVAPPAAATAAPTPSPTRPAATTAAAPAPADTPAAAGTTTATATAIPATPAASATAAGPVAGRNDDGTFFFGVAGAPLTLIDYSDFL